MEQSPTKSPQKKIWRASSESLYSELSTEIEIVHEPQNQKNDILAHCHISKTTIEEFVRNPIATIMNESLFYAVLCQIAFTTGRNTVVLPVEYMRNLREKEEEDNEILITATASQICYGPTENFDVIIIPIFHSGYYSIAFCERNNRIGTIRYFDTMGNAIDVMTRNILRSVAGQMLQNKDNRIYQTKEHSYNKADSEETSMIICCLIARLYLKHKERTLIDNLIIENEINLIKKYLQSIITNEAITTEDETTSTDTIKKRLQRGRANSIEIEERHKYDKERKRISRIKETDEERNHRRKTDKERKRRSRANYDFFLEAAEIDDDTVIHQLSDLDIECRHCKALHFEEEGTTRSNDSFNDCCRHGKVAMDSLPDPPSLFQKLFDNEHQLSKNFFNNIRRLNSSISFASLNPMPHNIPGRGPTAIKLNGNINFLINKALLPDAGETPTYPQLYLIDSREATEHRHRVNPDLKPELIEMVSEGIKAFNNIAKSYIMMKDELENQKQMAIKNGTDLAEVQLIFTKNTELDQRIYELPRTTEIAVVFVPGADNDIPETLFVVRPEGKELQILKTTNPMVDPMVYPLLFPFGTFGWDSKMTQSENSKKRLTRAEHTSFRLFTRKEDFNIIHKGRDLFQQYCADQSVRILKDRLDYIRFNQKKIMAESYKRVEERMKKQSEETGLPLGKKIILPSSITGTPRWEAEQFQDAMTMLMEIGRPDIFVTMTCNPNWPDIQNNLFPGQTASDRPDLVARVFDLKKDAMVEMVTKKKRFGEVDAFIYVIEWQHRGLPHCHMLITLGKKSKMNTATDVDKFICAQLPDPEKYPNLFHNVEKHMLHGPHKKNKDGEVDCGCYRLDKKTGEKKCRFDYPKHFNEETNLDENGYPDYARPNNGRSVEKCGIKLDNRWVAPYDPLLLLTFDCHINVERVFDIRSIKYLYKYIYKPHDRAELKTQIQGDSIQHDEIQKFIDGRSVSAPEGAWHILRKEVQKKSHTIIQLPIHLKDEQTVCFPEEAEEEDIEKALQSRKMLIEYFELNKRDQEAHNYFYHQIPRHYVWKNKRWETRREHFNTLGRMYHVSPSQGDVFYLRILLCNVKGAKDFSELFSFDNIVYGTYKEACFARGLIKDDAEWIKALEEAGKIMLPSAMRVFFGRILVHCEPSDPISLWEKFKNALSEDYLRTYDEYTAFVICYKEVGIICTGEGNSIEKILYIPELIKSATEINMEEQFDIDHEKEKAMEGYVMLNSDQQLIIDNVLNKIGLKFPPSSKSEMFDITNCIFVDGPGGTGKTTVYKILNHFLLSNGLKISNTAFTGIAAILLPKGRTLHNRFGLPVPLYVDSNSTIGPNKKEWQELKEIGVFIIDEASMIPKHALRVIDDLFQQITGVDAPFGGKMFILGGDFRQTLPIQKHATMAQQQDLCIKSSHLWKYFTKFKLSENMRALENEKEFADWVLKIGNGTLNDENEDVTIPPECICEGDLADEIFSDPIAYKDWKAVGERAILAPLNVNVDEINDNVLEKINGDQAVYKSIDSAEKDDNTNADPNQFPLEFLQSLRPQGFPHHELKLKKHATVMLMRNLNIRRGLSNGTRMEVIEMHQHSIECKIIGGDRAGEIEFIPRITLHCTDQYPFILKRHQFPLRLAFSFTIIKSQGQTMDKVGIDLRTDVFSHGQLYVALSRARSLEGIKIKLRKDEEKTKNIVYKNLIDI